MSFDCWARVRDITPTTSSTWCDDALVRAVMRKQSTHITSHLASRIVWFAD